MSAGMSGEQYVGQRKQVVEVLFIGAPTIDIEIRHGEWSIVLHASCTWSCIGILHRPSYLEMVVKLAGDVISRGELDKGIFFEVCAVPRSSLLRGRSLHP
jgi:hypothetical protein